MKIVLWWLLCGLLISHIASAQNLNRKAQLKIGVGTLAYQSDIRADVFENPPVQGYFNIETKKEPPVYYAELLIPIGAHFSISTNLSYLTAEDQFVLESNNEEIGTVVSNSLSGLLIGNVNWTKPTSLLNIYSSAGIGYSYFSQKSNFESGYDALNDDFFKTAFQFTAAGLRFGKGFAVFVELGFGYKGTLNAGLSFKL